MPIGNSKMNLSNLQIRKCNEALFGKGQDGIVKLNRLDLIKTRHQKECPNLRGLQSHHPLLQG